MSSALSIPIESYIVPDTAPVVPDGFTLLDVALAGPVPNEIALGDSWSIIVVVPSGSARIWLDADPSAPVSTSDVERAAFNPTSPPGPIAAARLVARRGGVPLAAIPLVAGIISRVWSPDGDSASLLELMPLAWDLPVAALVGDDSPSARLEIAWRTQFPTHIEAG